MLHTHFRSTDVADKLVEANTRLEADPNSTERIADKIKWRSESSLVEIRYENVVWFESGWGETICQWMRRIRRVIRARRTEKFK